MAVVLVCLALSAFCLVIEAISSSEEETSSRLEACSLAPSAIDWLLWATWLEAEAICSAPWVKPAMTLLIGPVMERVIKTASAMPTKSATIRADRHRGGGGGERGGRLRGALGGLIHSAPWRYPWRP